MPSSWSTLQCHFLMTCGQHVVRECSFCKAMSLPAGMVIGVQSSPMNIQSVATFDTPPGLDSWCALSLPLARTQCLHQIRNGGFVNSCCATPASLGNTGTFPGLGGTRSVLSQTHQQFDSTIFRYRLCFLCRLSADTPPPRSYSMRLPLNSLSVVSPELRNDIASVAHSSNRYHRSLESSVLGRKLKIARNVDTVWCAQLNRRCCQSS